MDYLRRYKKPLLTGLLLGMAVLAALTFFADYRDVLQAFARMDLRYLPLILLLAPLNYLLRFWKWNFYLRRSGLHPERRINRYIFMSGLSMTITPGKVGELLKCYLLKEHMDAPVSRTSSIVMAERLTDGLAMVVLAALGSLAFPYGRIVVPVSAAILLLLVLFFYLEKPLQLLAGRGAGLSSNRHWLRGMSFLGRFQQSARLLLEPGSLLYAVGISVISWGFEGFVVYFAVKGLGGEISLLGAIFVVSFASLLGALSFLPGGLGVAEGSIMAILLLAGLGSEIAAATTIITRLSTLWLGVLVGLAGLALLRREFSRVG